jgi:hypothetical protein
MDAEGMAKGDRPRVVYVNVNTMTEKPGMTFSEAYSAKVAAVLGIVHIICGLTAMAANTIGIMCGANIPLAAGIWSSVFFIASGCLAIAGARSTTKRLVVSTLVMGIISSLAACLLLLISSFSLVENRNSVSASDSIWLGMEGEESFALSTSASDSNISSTSKPADEHLMREEAVHNMRTGVYTTEVAVGLVMLLVATISSALTCHPLCCRGCRSKTLSKRAIPPSFPESARLTIPPELPPPYQAKTL